MYFVDEGGTQNFTRNSKTGRYFEEIDMDDNKIVQRGLNKYLYIPNGIQISQNIKGCELFGKNNKISGSIKGQNLFPDALELCRRISQNRIAVISKESFLIGMHKPVQTHSIMR